LTGIAIKPVRALGMGAFGVQALLERSYSSTVERTVWFQPPIA